MSAPLRILAVVNLPWDARLGASRVWMELTDEWTRAGHVVEKFCLTDAFPREADSSVIGTLRTAWFPRHAAAFLRENASRFDVVDCLLGTLPFTKEELGFRGLLVGRSVGLYLLYDAFLRQVQQRWPEEPRGTFFGRIFHGLQERRFRRNSDRTLEVCDLFNVPNPDERDALAEAPGVCAPAVVEPYGLSARFREELAGAGAPAATRLRARRICFIGVWSFRKGSRDWRGIMQAVWREQPDTEFLLLGTMFDEATVRADLGFDDTRRVTCRPKYDASELPTLLADCTLALFPSYIEGFGLAVLEQLAAGLPTIAYDVPGPRQILPADLLVPAGDSEKMAARAVEILALPLVAYAELADSSRAVADRFRWADIAASTIAAYRTALDSLGR